MTAIGRPLRGAQLVAPLSAPRVTDARRAAAARQRAAIQRAFAPVPEARRAALPPLSVAGSGAAGSGSIRVPRAAIPGGARRIALERGAIGGSAWSAGRDAAAHGMRGRVLGIGMLLFVAMFVTLFLATETSTAGALVRSLRVDQTRLMEQIRSGESDMDPLGREPEIRRRAFELGVGQLGSPLVVGGR